MATKISNFRFEISDGETAKIKVDADVELWWVFGFDLHRRAQRAALLREKAEAKTQGVT